MTPSEFKAWFDGFTEAFTGCPTKAQWTRIKARVAEIDGKPVTERVYVDRYVPQYPYYPRPYWQYLGQGACGATNSYTANATGALAQNASQQYAAAANNISNQIGSNSLAFNSLQAMTDLGRAEAVEIA